MTWRGIDDAGGSGIATLRRLRLRRRRRLRPVADRHRRTRPPSSPARTATPTRFYSVATDNVGHREAATTTPDAETMVQLDTTPPTVTAVAVNDTLLDRHDIGAGKFTVTVTFSEADGGQPGSDADVQPGGGLDADLGQRQLDGQHALRGDVRRGGRERGVDDVTIDVTRHPGRGGQRQQDLHAGQRIRHRHAEPDGDSASTVNDTLLDGRGRRATASSR